MPGAHFEQPRRVDLSARLGIGAAGMKGAAGRRIDRDRHVALQQPHRALQFWIGHRHRRQEFQRQPRERCFLAKAELEFPGRNVPMLTASGKFGRIAVKFGLAMPVPDVNLALKEPLIRRTSGTTNRPGAGSY